MSPIVLVIICLLMADLGQCRSVGHRTSDSTVTQTVEYLSTYGYLPSSSLASGNLRTEEQLKEAIKVMQRFGGLPETGEVDTATMALMKRKRCGMRDLLGKADRVKRYALQGQKWTKNRLTYTISQQSARFVNLGMVRVQVRKALEVWSDAANITFVEVARADADIVVSFWSKYHEDGYPFDGKGSVLAHAFFPGEGIGGDAHFDADEQWAPSGGREPQGDAVNLFSVAAHEFGHSLGLSHSATQGSLMFPYYQHITDNFKLPYDDTVGIQQLYGPKTPQRWAPMPPVTHKPPKTPVGQPPVRNPRPPDRTRPEEPPPARPEIEEDDVPQTCNSNLDAISIIRGEIFMFKNRYFWRRDDRGLKTPEPIEVDRFWKDLPPELRRVDAVYERKSDGKIVFFTGKTYWMFAPTKVLHGYPKPLTHMGLPSNLEKIDSAMIWGHNGKTYFFSGDQYWRFDEATDRVEADYPRHMGLWKGVPQSMDSAFQDKKGVTYFFKGAYFWKFDDKTMSVSKDSPRPISETWFGCPPRAKPPPLPPVYEATYTNSAESGVTLTTLTLLLLTTLTL